MAAFPALRPRRRLLRLPQTCVGCSRCSRSYGPYRPSPGHTLAPCPHSRIKCDRFPPFPATKSSGQQEEATNKAGRLPEVSAAARRPASVSLPAAVNQITDLTGYRPPATGHRLQATGHRPQQARPCRPCLAYLVTFPTTHLLRREVTRDLCNSPPKALLHLLILHSTATACPQFLIVLVISLRHPPFGHSPDSVRYHSLAHSPHSTRCAPTL